MAQPLAQYDIDKTPLDMADKDQFINHVNEEHQDELAMFIKAFTTTTESEYDIASIKELYTDGILMDVTTPNHNNDTLANTATLSSQYFINFTTPISESMTLQEQYITLLQTSANKLGKRTIKLQEQRFTVINGYYASPNMYRLVVTAPDNTPLSHPGYAYLFELDSDGLSARKNHSRDHSKDSDKPLQRYYTLRKVWQDSSDSSVQAWIDVYIHGDTAGGNWARALDCGVQIKTVREYPEKTEHLSEGQCLLICDETSLPTVANLLENWQNPLPPLVIAITNDREDSSYLQTLTLSHQLRHDAHFLQDNLYHLINTPTTDITEQIMALLNTKFVRLPLKIGKVWGAHGSRGYQIITTAIKINTGSITPRYDHQSLLACTIVIAFL